MLCPVEIVVRKIVLYQLSSKHVKPHELVDPFSTLSCYLSDIEERWRLIFGAPDPLSWKKKWLRLQEI
jgi:hypothetical protein